MEIGSKEGKVLFTVVNNTLSRANLSGADLSRANLSGADLSEANLSRADLSGADLYRANLSGANLSGANLSRANLYMANLYRANLSGANLSGANLSETYLDRADLSGTNLSGANLSETLKVKENGRHLFLGPIGSRKSQLFVVETESGLVFKTGCFCGTQKQFVKAVDNTHGDSTHGKNYMLAVDFVIKFFNQE